MRAMVTQLDAYVVCVLGAELNQLQWPSMEYSRYTYQAPVVQAQLQMCKGLRAASEGGSQA
jgi:hypothetical protein